MSLASVAPIILPLRTLPYTQTLAAMQTVTRQRISDDKNQAVSPDQIWWVSHPRVFTQGVAGSAGHILDAHDIPVVQSNRGGQVTYHGPGQLVCYTLLNLSRLGLTTRQYVRFLEQMIINTLQFYEIAAHTIEHAPGVYVHDAKIAAIGLRVSQGYIYHGFSLNVGMDLTPFSWINPCGYKNLSVTDMATLGVCQSLEAVLQQLQQALLSLYA